VHDQVVQSWSRTMATAERRAADVGVLRSMSVLVLQCRREGDRWVRGCARGMGR
jgi:hypothetical protein